MNFFLRRKYRKLTKHLLHEAHHARHMREDIAPIGTLNALADAEKKVAMAWQGGGSEEVEGALEHLVECTRHVLPTKPHAWWRENLEILVVALAVAMGFRTYFVQPFKIPTGSMQPTLYGITVKAQSAPGLMDRFPLNLIPMALLGERYQEVLAPVSGMVDDRAMMDDEDITYFIQNTPVRMRKGLSLYFSPGDQVTKGQLLASGRVKLGDHIFVNKVRYNFVRPMRGDIIVFDTDWLHYSRIKPHTFYIKRLVGLPGEEISINPPYLLADGKRITEPYPFHRLLTAQDKGYIGYILARTDSMTPGILDHEGATLKLKAGEYLPFGDNTSSSLDGRYFGGIPKESLIGPAFAVYWPFGRNWGFPK